MASEQESLPRDRKRVNKNGQEEAPSHMALDAHTFNAVVKVISRQPWEEANTIMQGLLSAKPVSLEAKQPTPVV